MPGLVDKFEKSFSAVSVSYPKDTGTAEIESKKKTIVSGIVCSHVFV